MKLFSLTLALALIPLFAAAEDPTLAHWLPTGIYGGNGASLSVTTHSAELDLPCAFGLLSHRPVLDEAGYFSEQGIYHTRLLTYPPSPGTPATFTGRLAGNQLWIQVALHARTGEQHFNFGPLRYNQNPRFFRCL